MRGRAVWSSGLSVQGFPQEEYEQLLELSAYFLQGTQAAALAAVLATSTPSDAELRAAGRTLVGGAGAVVDQLPDGAARRPV